MNMMMNHVYVSRCIMRKTFHMPTYIILISLSRCRFFLSPTIHEFVYFFGVKLAYSFESKNLTSVELMVHSTSQWIQSKPVRSRSHQG